jgi:acetyl esterase/lipase
MPEPRPGLDPELATLLAGLPDAPPLDAQTLELIRPYSSTPPETVLAGRDLTREERTIGTRDGAQLPLTILRPPNADTRAPCIYWLHGGGMVMGDRFSQLDLPLDWMATLDGAVVATIDYRLAPEFAGTTLVEDCYDGLVWLALQADELGVDRTRLIVAGTSAGGGLAAGVTLMARDRSGPAIAAQMLIYPMLDHRNNTTSSKQYAGDSIWSREANAFGWSSVLSPLHDQPVPSYMSPSLSHDLGGLPPTYIDAGSAEVFRDEDVDYATRIWAAGGQAELHVWAGGFHGFDALFPDTAISREAREARRSWLTRTIVS